MFSIFIAYYKIFSYISNNMNCLLDIFCFKLLLSFVNHYFHDFHLFSVAISSKKFTFNAFCTFF